MERSILVAAPIDVAYDRVLGDPVERLFDRRHLLLPAITGTSTLRGDATWGREAGDARRILLADGSSMVETLRTAEAPHRATYAMSDLTGPFAALYDGVLGEWTFVRAPHGTRVTWRWRLRPRGIAGRLAAPVIARMWQGYAAKALARVGELLGEPR